MAADHRIMIGHIGNADSGFGPLTTLHEACLISCSTTLLRCQLLTCLILLGVRVGTYPICLVWLLTTGGMVVLGLATSPATEASGGLSWAFFDTHLHLRRHCAES